MSDNYNTTPPPPPPLSGDSHNFIIISIHLPCNNASGGLIVLFGCKNRRLCNIQCFNCLKADLVLVGLEIMKAVHAMPESNNIIIIEVEALTSFLCINRLLDPFLDWL